VTPSPIPFAIPFAQVLPTPPPDFPQPLPPPGGSTRELADLISDLAKMAQQVDPRQVVRFGGGWLVGFNIGEYGGSLWWSPSVNSPGVKLLSENVVAIVPLRSGVEAMVFVGISHLNTDMGRVCRSRRRPPSSMTRTRCRSMILMKQAARTAS
jgi:hypothetical protein